MDKQEVVRLSQTQEFPVTEGVPNIVVGLAQELISGNLDRLEFLGAIRLSPEQAPVTLRVVLTK